MDPYGAAEQSEFRQDVISGRWVIFAPERATPSGQSSRNRDKTSFATCARSVGPSHDTPPRRVFPAETVAGFVCPNRVPGSALDRPDTRG